jgi:hypothetical protein
VALWPCGVAAPHIAEWPIASVPLQIRPSAVSAAMCSRECALVRHRSYRASHERRRCAWLIAEWSGASATGSRGRIPLACMSHVAESRLRVRIPLIRVYCISYVAGPSVRRAYRSDMPWHRLVLGTHPLLPRVLAQSLYNGPSYPARHGIPRCGGSVCRSLLWACRSPVRVQRSPSRECALVCPITLQSSQYPSPLRCDSEGSIRTLRIARVAIYTKFRTRLSR